MLVSALWPKSQANISLMFGEVTFGRRPAAAAAAGFEAIECWWPFTTATPASTEIEAFVATVADAGLQLRGLNFFAGDMAFVVLAFFPRLRWALFTTMTCLACGGPGGNTLALTSTTWVSRWWYCGAANAAGVPARQSVRMPA